MNQSISETFSDCERIRFDLIETELDLGCTFVRIAADARNDPVKQKRNTENARLAYDTACRLIARSLLNEDQMTHLQARTEGLRHQLVALEEVIP